MKKVGLVILSLVCLMVLGGCGCEKIEEYTVTFNSNGGSNVASVTVKSGELVQIPTEPTKEGYTFGGWYLDLSTNEKFDFNTSINKDLILNAKWIENSSEPVIETEEETETYKITFDSNGGSKVSSITLTKGDKLSLPTPKREGYTFLGWYDGKTKVTNKTEITKDIELVAKWSKKETEPKKPVEEEKTFTVTFDSNGGSSVKTQTVKSGAKVSKPANPTREGYTFEGWLNGTTAFDFSTKITKNITLTASWKKVEVKHTYSYVMEDVQGSTTGEAYLFLLKDNQKIAGECVITTDTGKKVTKEIPVTGYRTNKFKIKNVTNIVEK